jgi:hypothetical protein
MYRTRNQCARGMGTNLLLAAAVFSLATVAHSQANAADSAAPTGRIDFEAAKLPEANVEIDLSQEMFRNLFGIGDAAVAGVAETLLKSAGSGDSAKGTKLAAEQLESARQILQLAGNVVREVRVRVYESLPEDAGGAEKLFKPFDEQLRTGKWETIARVHDDENIVRVSAIMHEGSVQGIFVTATDGDSVVIANVLCDVSPENVKKLTSSATKIGLENGLAQVIEKKMSKLQVAGDGRKVIVIRDSEAKGRVAPPTPPTPPAPAAEAASPATR